MGPTPGRPTRRGRTSGILHGSECFSLGLCCDGPPSGAGEGVEREGALRVPAVGLGHWTRHQDCRVSLTTDAAPLAAAHLRQLIVALPEGGLRGLVTRRAARLRRLGGRGRAHGLCTIGRGRGRPVRRGTEVLPPSLAHLTQRQVPSVRDAAFKAKAPGVIPFGNEPRPCRIETRKANDLAVS
jgi:hypothetical protein